MILNGDNMQILETHANNEKEAIQLSSEYLGISKDELELQIFQKASGGFLGLGNKIPGIYHIYAVEGKTPVDVVIKGVISTILHKMGYKAKFVRFETQEDGKLYVEISSPHAGFIIGKRGKTLEAIQFLANLIVEKFIHRQPKILLDLENYRARRAEHLAELAKKLASQVMKTGKSRLLDPLNPYERRIIHLALQDSESVETKSEGNGVYKRIRITKKKTATGASPEVYDMESDIPDDFSEEYQDDNQNTAILVETDSKSNYEKEQEEEHRVLSREEPVDSRNGNTMILETQTKKNR